MTSVVIDRGGCRGTQHGTENAHSNHQCRCPDARRAHAWLNKLRKVGLAPVRHVSTVGVIRRRQALAVAGYGLPEVALYFGVTPGALLKQTRRSTVREATYRRWVEVYDLLSSARGPNELARERALLRGWLGPEAWPSRAALDDLRARPRALRRSA